MVSHLKGTRIYVNDIMVEPRIMQNILFCAGERKRNGNEYCYGDYYKNPFGCRKIEILLSHNRAWYTFSYLKNGEVFVDKQAILNKITNDLTKVRYCPFLNLQEIWSNFVSIPEKISLYDEDFGVFLTDDGNIDVMSRWTNYGYLNFKYLKQEYGDRLLSKR